MTKKITIRRPDDFHLHLRDDTMMEFVVRHTADCYQRAMIMPNLIKPVITTEEAIDYRERILAGASDAYDFNPLMTLYLTPQTKPEEVVRARESGLILAIKYYPAGATTNSAYGVTSINQCRDVIETMQSIGLPLSIHGEISDESVDVFDREKVFIDTILSKVVSDYPELKVVLEHLSTKEGVQFVEESNKYIAATITSHHLLLNRNDLLVGGLKPNFYCSPIVKTEEDRCAILTAAVSGNPKFFLGTDSAPHPITAKLSHNAAAGIYSAYQSFPIYTEIFDRAGHLEKLEGFASSFGAMFYGIPLNEPTITLIKEEQTIPPILGIENIELVPLKQGERVSWKKA